ncbi:L,D-transpeptidase [Candidatus Thiodictyon syntrophicum]|jgi:lipoprotein-anchoring transpeptidase ErfK/SrfK|nr:L,D-transpeptidase [Candidatus Thiodictyon syntrophicum]
MKYMNWFRVRLAAALLVAALPITECLAQDPFGTPTTSPPAPVAAPPADAGIAGAPGSAPADSAASATATPDGVADQAGAVGPAPGESSAPGKKEPALPSGPSRRLSIHLGAQRFTYTQGGQVLRTGPVSTGRRGYGTPAGSYRVLSKQRHKVSSRYAGSDGRPASMPYAIQFQSNYFIHQGRLPGYPASHGCVRLRGSDARFLFSRLRPGDPVLITH